jgi:hypothetical protein
MTRVNCELQRKSSEAQRRATFSATVTEDPNCLNPDPVHSTEEFCEDADYVKITTTSIYYVLNLIN